jgi:hypothetical protein
MVILAGLAAIAWVNWWFFLTRRPAAAAVAGAGGTPIVLDRRPPDAPYAHVAVDLAEPRAAEAAVRAAREGAALDALLA